MKITYCLYAFATKNVVHSSGVLDQYWYMETDMGPPIRSQRRLLICRLEHGEVYLAGKVVVFGLSSMS